MFKETKTHEVTTDVVIFTIKDDKLKVIKNKISQPNTYCVVEVKGGQGQHWVAIDSVNGTNIKMLDPGSKATNLWKEYDYKRTSMIQCFKKK